MKDQTIKRQGIDYLRLLFYITQLLLLLYVGRTLLIPLCFSLFLSILIYPVSKWFESKKFSKIFSIFMGLALVTLPLVLILGLMFRQAFAFVRQWPEFQDKIFAGLQELYVHIAAFLGIPLDALKLWINESISGGSSEMILTFLTNTISASSVSLVLLLLIPVYVALILYYRNIFMQFLIALFPEHSTQAIQFLVMETINTYYKFVKGMLVVYLTVGLLNSIGLYFIGVPDPFLYGFICSVLTVIPYFGILIGALVPIALTWIAFNSIWYPIGIVALFLFVQVLEANLIFPMAVGKRLEVNPLVVLLVVIGGGIIWGVSGMILFIPVIGILKIISDRVDRLKPLSILLGRGNQQVLLKKIPTPSGN